MNQYHAYLNLPFELSKPEVFNEFQPEKISHCHLADYPDRERMQEYLDSKGLRLLHIESFCSPPKQSLQIHLDEMEEKDVIKIIQTWGPDREDSVTRWWESSNTYIKNYPAYSDESLKDIEPCYSIVADVEHSTMMFEANTNRPSVINAGLLHDTFNPGPEHRWTLCFVIGKSDYSFLSFKEALELLKDDITD